MKSSYARLAAGLLAGLLSGGSLAATTAQIDTARNRGLWWLLSHQAGEGAWKGVSGADVGATATSLDALANAGVRGYPYAKGVSWLANARAGSVDSLSRQVMSLAQAGSQTKPLLDRLLTWKNDSTRATWGSYDRYATAFPDTLLAIAAIRKGQYTYTNQTNELGNAVFCEILPSQKADGSWSYIKPNAGAPASAGASAILPTALTASELNAIKTATGWDSGTCGTTFSITTALNNAITWLLGKRNADGGFGEGGVSTVLDTALAYEVLKILRPADASTGGALDYLIARQNAVDGSWGGEAFQTGYVLKLLPASALADIDRDGIPDTVEPLMGTNPSVADSRFLASPGNGSAVAGLTAPLVLAHEAVLSRLFSFTLTASGGTAPYTWGIASGSLPTGLGLASGTGIISGTPSVLGAYNFTYSVRDATGSTAFSVGQINVVRAAPSLATGDLNGDGRVDAADVALAERIALGLVAPSAAQLNAADVAPAGNPDTAIDAADLARLRLKALGIQDF